MDRFDNTPELKIHDFFNSKGIISFHSCVKTPELSSLVKRKHQCTLDVTQALLFQSCLPVARLGDCIQIVAYVIKRTLSPMLSNKMPFEILNHKKPSYVPVRAFNCLDNCIVYSFWIINNMVTSYYWSSWCNDRDMEIVKYHRQ